MKKNVKLFFGLFATIALLSVLSGCEDRKSFVGAYTATETMVHNGNTTTSAYAITITKSQTNKSEIVITNFAGTGQGINATVSGKSMVIPQTTIVYNGTSVGVSGSGSLNGNTLNFTYNANGPGGQANATVVALRK